MNQARILVVEDEGLLAMDTRDQLHSLGYDVPAIAFSGESALRKIEELQPDLVLMDIHLKGKMDGIETAARIRSQFAIPVIYVTAYADDATLQRAKLTEPLGYVLKPFEERSLHATIEMALNKHRLEQQRNEFLALLNHDIRNPLGMILGYADILEAELHDLNAPHAEMLLARLHNAAMQAHTLVTNYLDLSRIEAGQVTLTKRPISVNTLLQGLEQQYMSAVQQKNLHFLSTLAGEPRQLSADSVALDRVFSNLFANALKFTPEGETIKIESHWSDSEVTVLVRNTGPGIPHDELPFLFQKYRRVRKHQQREGLGLGLFIVKTLVEAHGGRVEVESIPDQETCFSVILPVEE